MKNLMLAVSVGALALTPLLADQSDKKTVITINAPMQIPTTTLQPGTYTLKLLDSTSNRNIVTVWDQDGMHLITTILAVPNYRVKPTGDSKFTMWETTANQPQALRAWFYPGDNFGQEFAYPKSKADDIAAKGAKDEVPMLSASDESKFGTEPTASAAAETAQVTTAPSPAPPAVVAEEAKPAASPEPTPTPTPAPAPAPAPTAAPAQDAPPAAPVTPMPETASHWRELMLIGVAMALAGLSTFFVQKERV